MEEKRREEGKGKEIKDRHASTIDKGATVKFAKKIDEEFS